jgi:DNA replication protein DnaC
MDWLIIWGVTQAAGALVFPIMRELAQDSAKDYAKGFLKTSLANVLIPAKDAPREAYGKAMKAFLEIFYQQLVMAGLSDDRIISFEQPLKIFIQEESVEAKLGDAFRYGCQGVDTSGLAGAWLSLRLPSLPSGFNWEILGRFYLQKIKEIITNSDKLKAIFQEEISRQNSDNIQEIAGIKTDFDLDTYAEGIKKEYGHLKLECFDSTTYERIKLWKIFIPQKVKKCLRFIPQLYEYPLEKRQELLARGEITQEEYDLLEKDIQAKRREYFYQPLYPVIEIVESATNNKLVFLGDPGSGKSSLLQYIALNWAEKAPRDRPLFPLPLLIELRIYARDKIEKKCQNFLEFFHQGHIVCHLNQNTLNSRLKKGDIIALFDGLDEVFEPQLREQILTDIKEFSIAYPQVKILITSRWLGYKTESLDGHGFEHFMLQELEPEQVKEFIQRWHDLAFQEREDKTRKQERLQIAIQESKPIRELAGNPLLLTMMAILNRSQELPRDRPKLYERATEVLLHEWDFERKSGLQYPELRKYIYNIDARDKKGILRAVANFMQAREKGLAANLIYGEDLESILNTYLQSTDIPPRDARDLTNLIIKQLRYRNFILCSPGGNNFAFVHRTFLEYFCASNFYEQFKKRDLPGGITLDNLKEEVFGKHWADSSWHEVLRLLIGILSAEFPSDIAESLINYLLQQGGESQEFSNVFLAVDCYSELRNRSLHRDLSQRLLEELRSLTRFTEIEIIEWQKFHGKVVYKIGDIWQDDPAGWEVLEAISESDSYWWVEEQALQTLSKIAQIHPEVLLKLQELAKEGRSWAINALAEYWREETQTFPIIQQLAQKGDSSAIAVLAEYWEEDGTIIGHFSTLRTRITDTEILVKSLQDLGITVKREADVRGAKGQTFRADIVAVLEGNYDIGWSRNGDGTFDLIANLIGLAKWHDYTELINSINQKYAINKTLQEARKRQKDLGS